MSPGTLRRMKMAEIVVSLGTSPQSHAECSRGALVLLLLAGQVQPVALPGSGWPPPVGGQTYCRKPD